MSIYNIWCEGYRATGESSGATFLGYAEGTSLKDACINLAQQDSSFASYFDANRMTYWGCRIYDNEYDARSTFG